MENKSQEILEYKKVLSYLAEFAISESGKDLCLNAKVWTKYEKIKEELDLTTQARRLADLALAIPLSTIPDVTGIVREAKQGLRLCEEEIYSVSQILRTSRLMKNFSLSLESEFYLLKELFVKFYLNKELEDKINDTFDSEIKVKKDATKELKRLWQILQDTSDNIKKVADNLMQNADFNSNLTDTIYTQRDGRGVFAVKAECKNKVQGIVHDVSATNRTYFIEPKELVALNNKQRETEILIQAETDRILSELSRDIAKFHQEILYNFNLLAQSDFLFAKAKFSAKFDMVPANLRQERMIVIKGMKNPVLMHSKTEIVENDFELYENKNCMIVTGSNTGGKTVAMKTVGLFVLMTCAGLHLPCRSAKIYPFQNVYADIGDEQSILQNLSTFSAHITNIKNIIDKADKNSLILLDEISAGTDPNEGAALAQSILEYIQKTGAFCVVTTHFGELKALSFTKEGFVNACVEFNSKTFEPTYKLNIGLPGTSNAISVAKNLGVKSEIVEEARELYFNQKDNSAKVMEELQNLSAELSGLKQELAGKKENITKLEAELKSKIDELKREKKKNLEQIRKKYDGMIENARAEVKEIIKEMREEKSEKIAMRSFNRLAKIESGIRAAVSAESQELCEDFLPIDWSKVKPGDRVVIKDLNEEVEILSLPDKNKNVRVQLGAVQSVLKQDKLAVVNDFKKKSKKTVLKPSLGTQLNFKRYEMSQTLDLRGVRCEEAIEKVEYFLDKAGMVNLTPLYIIHGHGTGALKQAVREYLKTSPYVKDFRPGENAEGGDGVSVVNLK